MARSWGHFPPTLHKLQGFNGHTMMPYTTLDLEFHRGKFTTTTEFEFADCKVVLPKVHCTAEDEVTTSPS